MKRNEKNIHSIDKTHSHFLEEFANDEENIIPKLKDAKEELKNKARKLKDHEIDEFMNIKDQISMINDKIKSLKSKKKKYFLDNSKPLFNYFEDKKNISSGEHKNVNVLNSFFKIKTEEKLNIIDNSKKAIVQYWKNVHNDIVNANDFIENFDI
jgi:hypothetical protein